MTSRLNFSPDTGVDHLQTHQSKLDGIDDTARLQLLIDAIVDYAIYMIDLDGTSPQLELRRPAAERLLADEIIGQSFRTFYTPEDRADGLPERALSVAARDGRFSAEGWRVRKDGSRFWASVIIDAIRDQAGELIGFAKVTRDITERQQAHEELLNSERRYRQLIEAVVDYAIFQLDPHGQRDNLESRAQSGSRATRRREIIGQHFSAFYTPEDSELGVPERALAEAARARTLRSGRLARAQRRHPLLGVRRHRSHHGRGRRTCRVCQSHARRYGPEAAPRKSSSTTQEQLAASPEAGSGRATQRRHRARLQQSADDRPWQSRNRSAARQGARSQSERGRSQTRSAAHRAPRR